MKYIIYILFAGLFILVACNNEQDDPKSAVQVNFDPENPPQIEFDTLFYDFGTLKQGEIVSRVFKFKNTGKSDLVIYDAYSTCGCTVPEYTKEPLKPGEIGKLEIIFNSEGKSGMQYKMVTLKLNTPIKEKSIGIRANII